MSAPPSFDQCKAELQVAGLKATHQRIVIYHVLCSLASHPDAEEVHALLRENHPTLSLGTVYRTLEAFVQAGLLKRFSGEDQKMRFDTNLAPHHHLIRQSEEKGAAETQVEDFEDDELNRLIAEYFRRHPIPGFQVESFQLNIHGKPSGSAGRSSSKT